MMRKRNTSVPVEELDTLKMDRVGNFIMDLAQAKQMAQELEKLNQLYETLQPLEILKDALARSAFSKPTVVSSFGADSAVMLHMIAQIRPDIPVYLIDTGKLFDETLRFRDRLQHALGLEDVRCISPRLREIRIADPDGTLHRHDPDQCCQLRKTAVLERALGPFNSWINGRKRYQSELRSIMPIAEFASSRAKLNPLANWSTENIREYALTHNLPVHPLVMQGYHSIGCFPCTSKALADANPRAGRWAGLEKSECGIHTSPSQDKIKE